MNDKPIVFYHSADLDGKGSAAIVAYHEKKLWDRECEFYGINYGDPFPWDKITEGRKVYMVDFSLQPYPEMIKLGELCDRLGGELHWIDHHRSAIVEMEKLGRPKAFTAVEEGKAGCELTWLYFNQDKELKDIPHPVMLLGRYDVWDEKCAIVPWDHILAFQYGMRLQETEPESELWPWLFGAHGIDAEVDRTKAIVAGGHAVLKYEAKQNEIAMSALSFETEFEGLRALAANRGPTNSKLFDSKWDPERHDIMISFYWSHRGEWKLSLYTTKEGIDCGDICKKHGGGGHPKAAGFQCKTLPFAMEKRDASAQTAL
jgi:oligoribonuclease NrnB/cAMP/cGMP phosphodiesterase (DHH superfamily)